MRIFLAGDTNVQNRDNPIEAFSKVHETIALGDIRICQAEGLFTHSAKDKHYMPLPYKEGWIHSTPEMLSAYQGAGFDALSMASNVSSPADAVLETLSHAARYSLPVCGIGKNLEEARKPAYISKGKGRVALLSRTSVFWPHIVPASDTRPGAATVKAYTAYQPGRRAVEMPGAAPITKTWPDETELSRLSQDIEDAKKTASCVILSIHWGVSSDPTVYEYQRQVARAAIDAGASIVFGHHPHVVSEIEMYRGSPIFYSLGNFAFDWEKARNRILHGITVIIDWDDQKRRVDRFMVQPVSRMENNLVAALTADCDSYREIVSFLRSTFTTDTETAIQDEEGAICIRVL